MTLAAPYFLAALAILVPVLITFLVRKQRRVMRVPSTMLWRLGAKSIQKSKRIRDVRRLVALLACLAAVALLALAAARPGGKRSTTTVYVIDVSASMAGGPMDDAKRFLVGEVTALGPNGRVAIITAGTEPKIVLPPSPPGPLVDRTIAALDATQESASIDEAMTLAEGLHAHVVVLSDHAVDKEASRGGFTEQKLFARSGKDVPDNLGITSLYTKTAPDARDDEEREATIVVATSSNVTRKARVKVTFGGKTLSDRTLEVPARGEATESVTLRGAGKLVARVASDDRKTDALAIDDEASLEEAARKPPHVALVRKKGDDSAAYFFVSRALAAAGVTEIDDVDIGEEAPKKAEVSVVLADGPARPKDVPSFFILTTPRDMQLTDPARAMPKDKAHLRSIATEDPIMRGVSLDEMTTLRALTITPPHGSRSLVDLDGGPAMVAGGSGKSQWVWLGIDPEASDLVLRVAFPVLVGNVLTHLGGASTVVSARTSPRDEVMLATSEITKPLETAATPKWRMPLSPPAFMAVMGALLLAFEAWWSFRRRRDTTSTRKNPA